MRYTFKDTNNVEILNINLHNIHNKIDVDINFDIRGYSNYLLDNQKDKFAIIKGFENIQNLKSWLHDYYFSINENCMNEYNNVQDELNRLLNFYSKLLNLKLIYN